LHILSHEKIVLQYNKARFTPKTVFYFQIRFELGASFYHAFAQWSVIGWKKNGDCYTKTTRL